jgi:hypothetical protein
MGGPVDLHGGRNVVRKAGPAVAGFLAVAVATGCAGPSRTNDDFRHKVANTAETFASCVQTGILTAELLLKHRMPVRYAASTVSEVEDDASSAQTTLDSRQPPSQQSDDLRDKADDVFEQALSGLTDLRVAVRRSAIDELPDLIDQLKQSASDLDDLQQIA